jgi:hypothetical protein
MKLKTLAIAHHRNGVAGAPFDVILFKEYGQGASRKVAVVFDDPGYCAVLDVTLLATGDIAFGSNSWRGDDYEPQLREAIKQRDEKEAL